MKNISRTRMAVKLGFCWSASMLLLVTGSSAVPADGEPPEWAYPLNRDGRPKPPADDGMTRHVPGSAVELSLGAVLDRFNAPDWHPDSHPPMPDAVVHGRKPDVAACAYCHLPNGQGRSENAALAGLSASYIIQQVEAFRGGQRHSAQPAMLSPVSMLTVAMHATPTEVASAAAYFAALTYKPWIRVVETDVVPRTQIEGFSAFAPVPKGGTEPINDRIVEVPENVSLTALRDAASGFVAYVPTGSLHIGETLVHTAEGTRVPCATCHGADLKGTAVAPPIAGRSPSYLYRQLYDIRQGARSGPNVVQMKQEISTMSEHDMLAIVAYISSLVP